MDPATGAVVASTTTVSADIDGSGAIDPLTESGLYGLLVLVSGSYDVQPSPRDGWRLTYRIPASYALDVPAEGEVGGIGFGYSRTMLISGQKFEDVNGNGSRDGGEGGLDGWTIQLVEK